MKSIQEIKEFILDFKAKNNITDPLSFGIAKSRYFKDKFLQSTFVNLAYKGDYIFFGIMLWALKECGKDIKFSDQEVIKITPEITKKILEIFKNFDLNDKEFINSHKNLKAILLIDEALKSNIDETFEFVILYDDKNSIKLPQIAYLKLYLLSKRFVQIRSINLNGIFAILPNVAWDYENLAYDLDFLRENEMELKIQNRFPNIAFVDKFPRMLSHIVIDNNIRILESSKVRLGAHIADKTTIMPGAAYVNFNAGTNGTAMVEGRISSSVSIGEGTDVGGGASILGVLSGTNGNPITIGDRCLLGANSVTGIPLGDDCIIDAGIAILEGTKIYLIADEKLKAINPNFKFDKEVYKGLELSNLNGLHFRQNSQTGQIIATLSKRAIKLNKDLH